MQKRTTMTKELKGRRSIVEEALNSVSLEGIEVSEAQIENFERYAAGKITLEQMDQFTANKFVDQ